LIRLEDSRQGRLARPEPEAAYALPGLHPVASSATEEDASEQTINRRLYDLRRIAASLRADSVSPLSACEAVMADRLTNEAARQFFADLPKTEKHYWISSLYALLMPSGRRQRLAAYFTPPHLVRYVLDVLSEAGIEPGRHRILDPASGGAAFLVPLAAQIAKTERARDTNPQTILRIVETSLAGVEIEPRLAQLSRLLLTDLLGPELAEAHREFRVGIQRANTLKLAPPEELYDAVVGNPPYGRVFRPSDALLSEYASVITDSYVNLYALFIEQSLRFTRPGGIVCLIVPMSFVGGAYFAALRKRILEQSEVLRVDPIDKRSDLFMDVLYDVCVLVLRKSAHEGPSAPAESALLTVGQPPRHLGQIDLPKEPGDRIWALPDGQLDDCLFQDGLETLAAYGYLVKTGYFVWNREKERYRTGFSPRANEVPLFWAHNIRPNEICRPYDRDSATDRIGMVRIAKDSTALIASDAILLQRTTNRRQKRRIIAGLVRKRLVPGGRGYVSENHTIVIVPDPDKAQAITLKTLCRLLNTEAVDARFRRISGSVSVSTKALRQLPLPTPDAVREAFAVIKDDEAAAVQAYTSSISGAAGQATPSDGGGGDDA
jgi:adenine-specific DNA-methyltransferase